MPVKQTKPSELISYESTLDDQGELRIHFQGRMDIETSPEILKDIRKLIIERKPVSLVADFADVTYLDDFGALVLYDIQEMLKAQNGSFQAVHLSENANNVLSMIDFSVPDPVKIPKKRMMNTLLRLGESAIRQAKSIKSMVVFVGEVVFSAIHIFKRPSSLRLDDTLTHMEQTGVDALPIVALISFLLGLIIAFMSSIQFRQFGAGIYVASLVAFAMVSELGPIMTAIIVAGRSGSAYAAEIGTMKISEEIDALTTMGFNPTLFLAIPRMIASLIVVPLLTLFSNIFAIAGGLIVGVFMLDLTPTTYMKQSIDALSLREVIWAMGKSGVFALIISWVGCLRGFEASGGASAVGKAATSAVVTSIFLIILFDSIFAVIRSYW